MYGMPAREDQKSTQVSDVSQQAAASDLLVNNLSYHQPEALSLAVQRSYSRQFFQRRTYTAGETAVIDFNSGTEYIDPGNSYITFTVNAATSVVDAAARWGWGQGSAMNVIKQVTIKSRSGTEIDRVERANVWSLYNTRYTNTQSYLARQGPMEGWYSSVATPVNPNNQYTPGTATRYAIPLKRLAPFFNPVKRGQKIPPQLMSGLHMELIFEDGPIAMVQGAGTTAYTATVSTYTIDNLAIMLDSICMTDDVQKTLNDQSANDGLEYAYPRVFTAQDSITSTAVNTQVRKAVSQANIAWAISLDTAHTIPASAVLFDSFAARVWDTTTFQYRLGALYYPIQAIQDPNSDGIEAYAQALETFDKFKNPDAESSVSYAEFIGVAPGASYTTTGSGMGVMAVSLEKDTALNFSGLPVNNSRVLECLATEANAQSTRLIVTFLEYMSVARAYVDNTAVAI